MASAGKKTRSVTGGSKRHTPVKALQSHLLYLPTQIRFPIGGERVTCHRRGQVVRRAGVKQINPYIICTIFELEGITKHLMIQGRSEGGVLGCP